MYQAMGETGVSFLEFAMSVEGWDVRPAFRNGKMVAVLKFQGPEFHFHSFGNYSFTRQDMRDEIFQPLWDQFGYARTRTPKTDTRQQRFNERFGFYRIGEDDHDIHYQIYKRN